MHMVKELDAGDMIASSEVSIPADATSGEVEQELCRRGKSLLTEAIHDLQTGRAHRAAQDPSQATYAHKIESAECEIDWTRPATEVHDLVRGVSPKPGAWCWVMVRGEKRRLKILKTSLDWEGELVVPCGKGALSLLEVQLEGKKPTLAKTLLAGYRKEELQF